jgi:hypothetical protein
MGTRSLVALLLCLPVSMGQKGAEAPSRDARIWVGRHREIEEYLRTAECVGMEMLGSSRVARCTLRPGGPVARMAWRPLPPGVHRGFRESYKAEIAAYELDKLLNLDMVPPSVERQLGGASGAAQLWVEDVTTVAESRVGADRTRWEEQAVRMRMFDALIGNRDRNGMNTLHDAAGNLILLDHSRAFGSSAELPGKLTRFDDAFWARIEALTPDALRTALGRWVDHAGIEAVLARRDAMGAEVRSTSR